MTVDLSKLSDAELKAMAAAPSVAASPAPNSLANMPDAELMRLAGTGSPDLLTGTANAASKMFTLGLSDQARALGRASGYEIKEQFDNSLPHKSFGQAYRDALANIHADESAFANAHPTADLASKGAGLLATVGLGSGAKLPATLAGKIWQGVKTGAGAGSLAGLSQSDLTNPRRTAENVALGGTTGAITGAMLPMVAEAASPAVNWGLERLGVRSPESRALSIIRDRAAQDVAGGGPTVQESAAELGNTPGMAYADVAGRNVKALGGSVYRSGGAASHYIDKTLNDRDAQAGTILSDAIDAGIARGPSNFTTGQALEASRQATAAPIYREAYAANPSVSSPELDRILTTPLGQQALSDARTAMMNAQTRMGVPDPDLTALARETGSLVPGAGGVASGLKLQTWDLIKRALDSRVAALKRQMGAGGTTGFNYSNAVRLKNRLTSELDRLDTTATRGPGSGLYAQARAAYAGPSAMQDAMNAGADIFKKHPDQIKAELDAMTPSERDSYLLGAANTLKDRIAKTSAGGNEANKIIGNEMLRRQIRPLFGTERGYQHFANVVRDVNRQFDTRTRTLANSATAERLAEDQGNIGSLGDIVRGATALAEGAPVAATLSLARAGGRGIASAINRRSPALNAALARMLYSADPRVQRQLLLSLMQTPPNVRAALPAPVIAASSGLLGNLRDSIPSP